MRVHELAKEFGINSKDLLDKLAALGIQAKNHMSALDPDSVKKIRASIPQALTTAAVEAPKTPAPVPAPVKPAPTPVAKQTPPAAAVVEAPLPKVAVAAPAPVKTPVPEATTAPDAANSKVIILKGPIVVRELAEVLGVRPNQLIAELMRLNVLASISESIEIKDASRVAEKHGFTVEREKKPEHKPLPVKKETKEAEVAKERAIVELLRPPVVTVLGHVDHGKTSLLDRIRNTTIAKGESGGITQHIGASTVGQGKKRITFLDTPGHEAFTAMRARGATMTDIAIIVVDAQDGLMPQTQEAIKHAQAAKVPIMVAINKIDLPGANPDRVKQQLAGISLTPEDWGGSTICCLVSALTGQGVPELLDMILLQAEVLELKANPGKPATGFVIESQLEPGMGPTANLLVSNGTLNVGDIILCGPLCGRVRALIDDHGTKLKTAGPATPVKCLGLPGVPQAGAAFEIVADEKTGRAIAEERQATEKLASLTAPKRASLANIFDKLKENDQVELNLIIKTDVQGSLEAIAHALKQIKSDKVSVNIIMSGVGGINANDVLLASASNAIVIGFHVSVDEGANRLSKKEGVEIRLHSIIYELVDQVREGMTGLLVPLLREKVIGHAEIKQVFTISKGSVIAGCMCTDGKITSRCKARVKRAGAVVFEGTINSLRRFQNDVSEVKESQECGVRLENFSAYAEGDILEFFDVERIAQTL
jgi:translation initiation factor IF-2